MTADAPQANASPANAVPGRVTRLVFMGSHSLADGFRLIGFETHADPEPGDVNRVLRDLQRGRDSAFVILDDAMMDWDLPMLAQLRREGGRIIVVSLPPLESQPPQLTSDVAARLQNLFGSATISPEEST